MKDNIDIMEIEIIAVIARNHMFSYKELRAGYLDLKSFDRLIVAVKEASGSGRSLHATIAHKMFIEND